MKYIVCREPGKFEQGSRPIPNVKDDEALLAIKRIGVCGTDLHAFAGNQPFFQYPRILGHELSAEVVALGSSVDHLQKGDRVVVMPYITCGHCVACRANKSNCCTSMQVIGVHCDGGMQEYFSINAKLLHPANHLSHDEIALVEPLAIGAHAVGRAQVIKDQCVVVVGCGPIGLGIAHFARQRQAKVIVIDRVASRLDFARQHLELDHAVLSDDDPISAVKELTGGDFASIVIDATGSKAAIEAGIKFLAHGGSYVLVGIVKDHLQFYHPEIQAKETSLLCSRNATWQDFQTVLETLEKKHFPTDAFITHHVPFDKMIDAFETWLDPKNGVIKAMIGLQ